MAQQTGFSPATAGASIATSGNVTTVRTTSEKSVINWQSLNVPNGSTLQFIEPNSSAIVLNRVLGGSVSQINGNLIANGIVWIINPAGVMFGQGASVNVAGLIATTSNISDQNFLGGNFVFDQPSADASAAVVNRGSITVAAGGAAVLAGARVTNSGLIEADLGKVVLASGAAFTVDFTGDSLISFAVSAPLAVTPLDRNGNPVSALVANSGTISAAGGEVLLTAQAARNVLTNVINVTGMIEATSAHVENGAIVLDAGQGSVTLGPSSVLDASGNGGGGTISVSGGDVSVAEGALLNANAISSGNGGSVTIEASDALTFNGAITVEGGAAGGNGGFADTSGANVAISTGTVDALAPSGAAGTWLLDPANITVQSGGVTTLAGNACTFSNASCSTIDPSAIENAAANVTLQATSDITFNSPITMGNSGIGITATAGDTIAVNAAITTNGGALTFTANSNGAGTASGSGSILIAAPISTLGTAASAASVSLTVLGGTGTIATSFSGAGPAITGGTVTLQASNPVSLPNLASTTLFVTAPGISESGAVSVGGEAFLSAGSDNVALGNAGNSFAGGIFVTAANATLVASGTLDLGTSTVTNNLTLTASGDITTAGPLTVPGTLTLTAGPENSIDLSHPNELSGPIVFTQTNFLNLTLDNAAAPVTLPALSIARTLSVTAPGISESSAVSVGGEAFLSAGSDNVALGNAGNSFAGGIFVTAANAMLVASGTLDLGTSTVTNNLTLTASGDITTAGPLTVPGTLTLTAGPENSIDLSHPNELSGPIVFTQTNFLNLTLDNAAAPVTLPALSIARTLSVTAPGISESSAVSVGGEAFLSAGSDNVALGNAGNSFAGGIFVTAANAMLVASGTLDLGTSTVTNNLTLTASGDITTAGPLTVSGKLTLGAGADHSIDLDFANRLSGPVVFTQSNLFDLTLDNAAAPVTLPALAIAHDLFVTAPTIAQSGSLSVGNDAFLSASGDVLLGNTNNSFGGAVFLTAANATLAASGTIDLGNSTIVNDLTVTAGNITSSGPISVGGVLAVSVPAGNEILLGDPNNAFSGTISLGGSDFSNLAFSNTAQPVVLPALTVAGDLSVMGPGVTQSGTLTVGGTATLDATGGANITLTNSANSFGGVSVTGAGDVAIVTATGVTIGTVSANSFTMTAGGPITLAGPIATTADFDALTSGDINITGTLQNAGSGSITIVAGWDGLTPVADVSSTPGAFGLDGASVTIGGLAAPGSATIGSASGTTTIAAANLTLEGVNGFAQIGYVGSNATGNIAIVLTGNLLMAAGAAGDYVQIGHGGAGSTGSESGEINIVAGGSIGMTGGTDTDAYAQIGHGGALSNFGTTVAFSDTGDIILSGAIVSLAAGLGNGAYVQIGNGGLDAGADASLSSGSIVFSGNIDLTATSNLVMTGNSGTGAYAQIGNGGFGADTHAALLSGGTITETGDIVIATGTAASAGSIDITGDAYSQIGNGGYDGNGGASASGINEGGNISISLNGGSGTINAGDQGNFAYGQVGNGDASHTGDGNVSGNIDVTSSGQWALNGSPNAPAWMWNATGSGSVTGGTEIDGVPFLPPNSPPPPPLGPDLGDLGGLNGVITTNDQAPPPPDLDNPPPATNPGSNGDNGNLGQNLNNIVPTAGGSSGAGAIEQMTDSSGGQGNASGGAPSGAGQEADELSSAVALSLTKVSVPTETSSCIRTNSGTAILCQIAPEAAGQTPVGVQSADQPYSSWGNESLWQQ